MIKLCSTVNREKEKAVASRTNTLFIHSLVTVIYYKRFLQRSSLPSANLKVLVMLKPVGDPFIKFFAKMCIHQEKHGAIFRGEIKDYRELSN